MEPNVHPPGACSPSRPVPSIMAVTSHRWLFVFKLTEESSVPQIYYPSQVRNSHMWLVPTLFNSTDIQSIFINTEQKVLLYSATTVFQNPGPQRSLTGDTQAVFQACAGLFPGSVLLKVNCISSVCVPRSEEWPKDDSYEDWGRGE